MQLARLGLEPHGAVALQEHAGAEGRPARGVATAGRTGCDSIVVDADRAGEDQRPALLDEDGPAHAATAAAVGRTRTGGRAAAAAESAGCDREAAVAAAAAEAARTAGQARTAATAEAAGTGDNTAATATAEAAQSAVVASAVGAADAAAATTAVVAAATATAGGAAKPAGTVDICAGPAGEGAGGDPAAARRKSVAAVRRISQSASAAMVAVGAVVGPALAAHAAATAEAVAAAARSAHGAVVVNVDVAHRQGGQIGDEERPAKPGTAATTAAAGPATRDGIDDDEIVDRHVDRDRNRRAALPGADEEAAVLAGATQAVALAIDGDVGLHRRQVANERDVRPEADRVAIGGVKDRLAQFRVIGGDENRHGGVPPCGVRRNPAAAAKLSF